MAVGDAARARLEQAAEGFLAGQRAAFDTVRSAAGIPDDEETLAEGYRWVSRLVALAQEWVVENADPLHPHLFVLQNEYRKLLVDNPDVRYLFAVLDEHRAYRLSGTRGDAAYVGLTFGTPFGQGAGPGGTGTTLQVNLDQFDLGPHGEVDLLIAPAGHAGATPPGRVIDLRPGTAQVAVRETFFDRRHDRPAELLLELVDPPPPAAQDAEGVAGRLEFAGLLVQFVARTALSMWADTAGTVNRFSGTDGAVHVAAQEDEVRSHSDAEMTYHGGRFVLADGEALVVTVPAPDRPFLYWGLTLATPWMESFEYRYRTCNLNNRTAERSPDGSWRLVVSPTDPGTANWLDTGGRRTGYMIVRWVLADAPPHPTCQVVPLASLG